jgi:hypothetical protein
MIPHLNRRWKLFGETTVLTPTVAFELSLARIDNCPRGIGFESNPAVESTCWSKAITGVTLQQS